MILETPAFSFTRHNFRKLQLTISVRGRQEGHQMVATKEEIPARR